MRRLALILGLHVHAERGFELPIHRATWTRPDHALSAPFASRAG
jgi:hypothetical protein